MSNTNFEQTTVVFRKWRDTGSIIALFPHEKYSNSDYYLCTAYEHVGQHGSADYHGCISLTKPATEPEYRQLKKELQSHPFNYKLKVVKRAQPFYKLK